MQIQDVGCAEYEKNGYLQGFGFYKIEDEFVFDFYYVTKFIPVYEWPLPENTNAIREDFQIRTDLDHADGQCHLRILRTEYSETHIWMN